MHVVRRAACALVLLLVALVDAPAVSAPTPPVGGLSADAVEFLRENPKLDASDPGTVASLERLLAISGRSTTPVQQQAAIEELESIRLAQSWRTVVRILLPLSAAGGRSPDKVLVQLDARGKTLIELFEDKATTGYRPGKDLTGVVPPPRAATADDIKGAVRSGIRGPAGKPSQLGVSVVVDGKKIRPGGTLAVRIPAGSTPKQVAAVMKDLAPELSAEKYEYVHAIVFVQGHDNDVLGTYRRADEESISRGTYGLDPRGRDQLASAEPLAFGPPLATLTSTVLESAQRSLGGIDFTDLGLRYVSDAAGSGEDRAVSYAFQAPTRGGRPGVVSEGIANARQASDAFFVWLALPRSSFWVNLQPNQPDRVIDPTFGRTDAGKVLLQSDLKLKEAVGPLLRPSTPTGARFWRGVVRDPSSPPCISGTRVWITPAVASVHDEGDRLYILDAPLAVQLETGYQPPPGAVRLPVCPAQSNAVEEHNNRQLRTVVLPALVREVNTGAAFAPLRRVYLSRVAAEWYRHRSQTHPTAYDAIIDSGRADRWLLQGSWRPKQTYDTYVRVASERAVRFDARVGGTTYRFAYGGVDFSGVSMKDVDGAASASERYAIDGWIGATTEVDRAAVVKEFPRAATVARPAAARSGLDRTSVLLVGGIVLAGLALLVVALARSRPRKAAHD